MNSLQNVFEHGTDAVFGIDAAGQVLFANRALQGLLGYTHDRICGSQCAELLCGTDLHGQAFCGKECPIPKAVAGRPAFSDFDLMVKCADGERLLVNIGACYPPSEIREQVGQVNVFFGLRPIHPRRLLQRMAADPGALSPSEKERRRSRLSPRESQILHLAAKGMRTWQIAERLFISTQTVRTHFKNIYRKIGAHSRTEAVLIALQRGLIVI